SLVATAADYCRLSGAARGGAKPDAGGGLYRLLARNGGSHLHLCEGRSRREADMPGRVGLACLGRGDPTGPYRIAPIARFLVLVDRVPQYAIGLRLRRTTLVSQTRQRSA